MKCNYFNEVKNDVKYFLDENSEEYSSEYFINLMFQCKYDENTFCRLLEEKLYDVLFIEDSVTGNSSGSYTYNRWEAEENLCHNGVLIQNVINTYGIDNISFDDAEGIDVSIRCFILEDVIKEVVAEILESTLFELSMIREIKK